MQEKLLNGQFFKRLIFLVAVSLLTSHALQGQQNYVVNGSASATGNNCFTLTNDQASQNGSVWYQQFMSLSANFDFTFTVNLGSNVGGADGIAFVMQPLSTGQGAAGSELGYGGITPSIDIEYDTYTNLDTRNDPPYDHISIQKNGNASHYAADNTLYPGGTLSGPVQASTASTSIKDGKDHVTRITWDVATKTLSVYFDGVLRITYSDDIVSNSFGGNPNVYWGFTGSTGLYSNLQKFCVTATSFTEVPSINISSTNVSCYGSNDGSATATVTGGTTPYTILWNNGQTTFSINNLSAGTYTATVKDALGVTASQSVTITQPSAPVLTCPSDIIVNAMSSACSAVVNYALPVVGGNCTYQIIQSAGLAPGSAFPVGTTINSFQIKDASSNVIASCSFQVVVVDNLKPTISAALSITVNNDPGKNYATVSALGTPLTSDNCGIASVTNNHLSSSYPIGTTRVTWTATDIHGNTDTAAQLVTVKDNEPPNITCLTPIIVDNDINVCGAIVNFSLPVATDNVSTNTTTVSAGCGDGSITFDVPSSGNVSSINFVSSGAYADIAHGHGQNNTITVELFDASTNRWVLIKTIQTGSGDYHFDGTSISFPTLAQVTQIRFTSTETVHCAFHFYQLQLKLNSSLVTQTGGLASGSLFPIGTTTNTFVATDVYGNVSRCSFDVTVNDTQKPIITGIPANVIKVNDAGTCGASVNWLAPTASDNCGVLSLVADHQPGDLFPTGTTTVTYTATDIHNNITKSSFTITVNDNEKPSITAPKDIIAPNTKALCSAVVNPGIPTTTDNCKVDFVLNDHPSNIYLVGTTVITWTVKDISGNTNTAKQTITVTDTETPVIIGIPLNIIQTNDVGICGAKVSWSLPQATDNCPGVLLNANHVPGEIFPIGVTTVTYTATDAHNNISTGSFTITIIDNEAPKVIVKPVTVTLVNGAASITAADLNNGSYDNCDGGVTLSASQTLFSCANIGTNNVLLTVTDGSKNSASAMTTVTVVGDAITSSITAVPSDNTYTGGIPTNIYIGYGPQSATLKLTTSATSPNISWTGGILNCYNCANPVFTATTPGLYTFTAKATNQYGCTTTSTISICVRDIRVVGTTNKVYLCDVGKSGIPSTLSVTVSSVSTYLTNNPDDHLGSCDILPCSNISITSTQRVSTDMVATDTAIASTLKGLFVKVSPNPTSDRFTLWVKSNKSQQVNVRIIDLAGRTVDEITNVSLESPVYVGSKLSPGSYYAEVVQGEERRIVKLIKMAF